MGRALRDDEITVVAGYEGPVYGVPDDSTIEAIHLAARTEGMLTDPVILEIVEKGGHDLEKTCQSLIARGNANGGVDNITVVMVEFSE